MEQNAQLEQRTRKYNIRRCLRYGCAEQRSAVHYSTFCLATTKNLPTDSVKHRVQAILAELG